MSNQINRRKRRLVVYGHNFCPQVLHLVKKLKEHQIDYEWRDVSRGKPGYKRELLNLANGNLSVPTVILPDGEVLVEPFAREVLKKLGHQKPGLFERLFNRLRGPSEEEMAEGR